MTLKVAITTLDFLEDWFNAFEVITIDSRQAADALPRLLAAVEQRGEIVLICREGQPIAELRGTWAIPFELDPLASHSELIARIDYDPTEPASDDEWPREAR